MSSEEQSLDWDADIYGRGNQLNIWPFTDVVSQFHKFRTQWKGVKAPRVLEIGCGTGNNLVALAGLGFEVWGIDQSQVSIDFGRRTFEDSKFPLRLSVGNIHNLAFDNGSFDFVLDRGALVHVLSSELNRVVSEVHRVLANGGIFAGHTLFGENHPDKAYGRVYEGDTYDFFTEGYFRRVGRTTFFSLDSIQQMLGKFSEISISRRTEECEGKSTSEVYSFEAVKDLGTGF